MTEENGNSWWGDHFYKTAISLFTQFRVNTLALALKLLRQHSLWWMCKLIQRLADHSRSRFMSWKLRLDLNEGIVRGGTVTFHNHRNKYGVCNLDPVDRDGHNNQLQVLKQDAVLCSFFSINHQTLLAKQVCGWLHCPVYLGGKWIRRHINSELFLSKVK